MKIVVTGGAGFIGSHLVDKLIKLGHNITLVDNLSTGNLANLEQYSKLTDINFNIKLFFKDNTDHYDLIYHLGMPSSSPLYKKNPLLVSKTVEEAIYMYEYAKQYKTKVILISSSSLYNGNKLPFHEFMDVYPFDYYTECRYYIERVAKLYNQLHKVPSIILRLFSVYGPREHYKKQYANMLTQILWNIMENRSPIIYGDGTQTRDFIYIDDVIRAFLLAKDKSFIGVPIFNIGTGVSYSFNQVITIINKLLNKNIKPTYVPNPIKNYVYHTRACTNEAKSLLKFKAKISLPAGIKKCIEAYS